MLTSVPRQARPEELAAAFHLLFAHRPTDERTYRVTRAMEFVAQGELDPSGVFVLADLPDLAGMVICQLVAGAGALIWPPVVRDGPQQQSRQDGLVRHACDWLRDRGARLTQCLLADDEVFLAESLLRNGFAHVTGLTYMRHDPGKQIPSFSAPRRSRGRGEGLVFTPYDQAQPHEFHTTLARTYEGTLDCPEVNGVRSIDEVVQGHQAQGRFDPSRWWLARLDDQPAGVLILAEQAGGEWDLGYVGIVPEARRRGLGRDLVSHGLRQARAAGAITVTLCVDDRNSPARRLYEDLGFEVYDHRQVLLAVWRRA